MATEALQTQIFREAHDDQGNSKFLHPILKLFTPDIIHQAHKSLSKKLKIRGYSKSIDLIFIPAKNQKVHTFEKLLL